MPMNVRLDGDLAILSNFARLMNDPRHFDASREVDAMLDQGRRAFVIELSGVGAIGPAGLGLLTTLTRQIRQDGGEAVLAGVRRELERHLEDMRMDAYWDVFRTVDDAKDHLLRHTAPRRDG